MLIWTQEPQKESVCQNLNSSWLHMSNQLEIVSNHHKAHAQDMVAAVDRKPMGAFRLVQPSPTSGWTAAKQQTVHLWSAVQHKDKTKPSMSQFDRAFN